MILMKLLVSLNSSMFFIVITEKTIANNNFLYFHIMIINYNSGIKYSWILDDKVVSDYNFFFQKELFS